MKGVTHWSWRPYMPADRLADAQKPYVCRLAPAVTSVSMEILDNGAPEADHIISIRIKGTLEQWRTIEFQGTTLTVEGLQPYCDYEFYIARLGATEARSTLRFVRTGFYPDQMVHYVHPKDKVYAFSGHYLCDPTFVRVPSGALVAAMDVYAPGKPQNMEILFRSKDNGKTWKYLCDLVPAYWGTLFLHRGVLYLIGVSTENGNVLIGASYDEGATWKRPSTLFIGGATQSGNGFQMQPMPIIEYNGRLMKNIEFGSWPSPSRYGIGIISVPVDADLLEPANWTVSAFTHYDRNWPGSPAGGHIALLEGSLYEAADGKIINLLRMQLTDSWPNHGKACLLEVDPGDPEAAPRFHSIIDMPSGANNRTHVLRDPVGGKYWAIGTMVTNEETPHMRNVMVLSVSDDGYSWRLAKVIHDFSELNPDEVGLQYTSFIFDGDDILHLTRTAFNQANNYHDANCQTFGMIKNFRSLA